MTTVASAKIYEFPKRGRFALSQTQESSASLAPHPSSRRVVAASAGEAWYHDEAIKEAEQQRH